MIGKSKKSRAPSIAKSRRRRKKLGHALRGLVMEGLGVVVLVFLYLTVQASTSASNEEPSREVHASSNEVKPSEDRSSIQLTGHVANTWSEYQQKRQQVPGSYDWLVRKR